MNYYTMWDLCGAYDSAIARPVSAEFLYNLNPEGTTMLSKQNPDGTDGDPILVQYTTGYEEDDWDWSIYETVTE